MPNYVKNNVRFTGTKKQIIEFFNKYFKEKKDNQFDDYTHFFDFNNVIKTPDDIFQGNLGSEEREKYGDKNWYDWNLKNWGTKWNSCENQYDDIEVLSDKPDAILQYDFSFQTAWSTPEPVITKLMLDNPELLIEVDYADEDLSNNCGSFHMDEGNVEWYDESGNMQFACDVWGYDIDEVLCDEELEGDMDCNP